MNDDEETAPLTLNNRKSATTGVLNQSHNVLLLYRLEDFQRRSNVNFWLALLCLVCCGINLSLLVLNFVKESTTVSHHTFHVLEFWTTALYALVEAYALVESPKTLLTISDNNVLMLKILFLFNVVAALLPAVLITLDSKYFERIAHQLEYINEFSLALVSLILLLSLLDTSRSSLRTSLVSVILSLGMAAMTLTIYNLGHNSTAHTFEFSFNILSNLVTFWFCMDNRFVAEMEMGQILFGRHADCNLCKTSVTYLQTCTTTEWKRQYGSFGASGPGSPRLPVVEEAVEVQGRTVQ